MDLIDGNVVMGCIHQLALMLSPKCLDSNLEDIMFDSEYDCVFKEKDEYRIF